METFWLTHLTLQNFPQIILLFEKLSKNYDTTLTCDCAEYRNRSVYVILRRWSDKAVAVVSMNKALYAINLEKELRSSRESQTLDDEDDERRPQQATISSKQPRTKMFGQRVASKAWASESGSTHQSKEIDQQYSASYLKGNSKLVLFRLCNGKSS